MTFTPKSWTDGTILTAAGMIDLETRLSAYTDLIVPAVVTVQTASYTLVLGDAGTIIEMNVASANNLTVPTNASVAFVVGTVIEICQYGAGQVTIVAAGGVTLDTPATLTTRARYSSIGLRKHATNEWIVSGDLS